MAVQLFILSARAVASGAAFFGRAMGAMIARAGTVSVRGLQAIGRRRAAYAAPAARLRRTIYGGGIADRMLEATRFAGSALPASIIDRHVGWDRGDLDRRDVAAVTLQITRNPTELDAINRMLKLRLLEKRPDLTRELRTATFRAAWRVRQLGLGGKVNANGGLDNIQAVRAIFEEELAIAGRKVQQDLIAT